MVFVTPLFSLSGFQLSRLAIAFLSCTYTKLSGKVGEYSAVYDKEPKFPPLCILFSPENVV